MINKNAPFPQADDFDKIVALVNVANPSNLKKNDYVSMVIGELTDRQVGYYLAACKYLGLVDDKRVFTKDGERIRKLVGVEQISELARLIVSDDIFGTVYFQQKMLGVKLERSEIVDIMKEYITFNSEEMYARRASSVAGWVNWIISNEKEIFE